MSATLVAAGLSAGFGDVPLFDDLSLVIAPGDVIGLVGVNGAGKSTLLRLLAGQDAPLSGRVSVSPPEATVGHLPQEIERRPDESIVEHLHRRTAVADAQREMDAAAADLESPDADPDRYGAALERWLALGGADLDERIPQVLADLGLHVDPSTAMVALSGGQAARVNLAALLLARFDVLLLDEPTNDLDLDGLDRLEEFVVEAARRGVALVIVSHDREFLSRSVNRVVELDLAQHQVGIFGGGYESYLAEREVKRQHARDAYDEYADKKSSLQERARTQRAWADKGIRAARKKTDNDKVSRGFRIEATEKQAAKARQTDRLIERMTEVAEPRKEWVLQYSIATAPGSSAVVLTARGATARRGDFVLGPVDLHVSAGDRIAVTGPNGSGKTTLLSLLLGDLPPQDGTVSRGASVAIGRVDQARSLLDTAAGAGAGTVLDVFERELPDQPPAEIRTLLAKFGLYADLVRRAGRDLSPGERTRAALALLQARGVNLLVLDEPTNHLDLPAIVQLEQALASYAGTLLLVTHDRRMLQAVHVDRHWEVRDGRVTQR